MLALDDGPHLLGLAVEGVVVAGRQGVGAEHDAALHLVAEALVAGLLHQLDERRRSRRAVAVADTVVAGQVRGRLGRGDEVVAGEAVLDGERSSHSSTLAPSSTALSSAARTAALHAGLDPLDLVQLARHADPQAGQILCPPGSRPARAVDRRRVRRIAAGDDRVQERASRTVFATGPTWSRLDAKATMPVAGHRPVGRAQADVAAERGRELDRAAGVRAERPRREPRRDRRRRAAAGAARDARRIPRVARRPEGGVLRGGAHRELVRVGLAENRQAARLAARGDGRVVHRDVVLEDLRARGRADPLRRDHVLERDRDALPFAPRRPRGTRSAPGCARSIAAT